MPGLRSALSALACSALLVACGGASSDEAGTGGAGGSSGASGASGSSGASAASAGDAGMVDAGSAGVGGAGASSSGAGGTASSSGSSGKAGSSGSSGKAGSATAGAPGTPSGGQGGALPPGAAGPPTFPTPCDNAVERIEGSGIMECDNGLVHRPTAGTCPEYVPSASVLKPSMVPDRDECFNDGDCTERPYGFCVQGSFPYGGIPSPHTCAYGCTVDAECDDDTICVCSERRGDCRPATCATDGDCNDGAYCAEYSPSCERTPGFSCQAPSDECQLDSDCDGPYACAARDDGTRYCTFPYCAG